LVSLTRAFSGCVMRLSYCLMPIDSISEPACVDVTLRPRWAKVKLC